MRIKHSALLFAFFCTIFAVVAQTAVQTTSAIVAQAVQKENAAHALAYIDSAVKSETRTHEKRSAYAFKGFILEQLGKYTEAAVSYALAIAQENHDQNNILKLSAASCLLNAGNAAEAAVFVNSVLLTAFEQSTLARARVYAVWVDLCQEQGEKRFTEIMNTLQTFLNNPAMKEARPSVLFTLWWLTDDAKFAVQLKNEFPLAPETAIAQGKSSILPAPFCYFVPRIAAARAAAAP